MAGLFDMIEKALDLNIPDDEFNRILDTHGISGARENDTTATAIRDDRDEALTGFGCSLSFEDEQLRFKETLNCKIQGMVNDVAKSKKITDLAVQSFNNVILDRMLFDDTFLRKKLKELMPLISNHLFNSRTSNDRNINLDSKHGCGEYFVDTIGAEIASFTRDDVIDMFVESSQKSGRKTEDVAIVNAVTKTCEVDEERTECGSGDGENEDEKKRPTFDKIKEDVDEERTECGSGDREDEDEDKCPTFDKIKEDDSVITEGTVGVDVKTRLVECVISFYREVNSAKATEEHAKKTVEKFAGREKVLHEKLVKKYGRAPGELLMLSVASSDVGNDEMFMSTKDPFVFLRIRFRQDGAEVVEDFVVRLFKSVTPRTCENFRALWTGEKGGVLTFRGSPLHRIIPHTLIQGGDITVGNGTGGRSIYEGSSGPEVFYRFPDENFAMKHDRPGRLSMANCGPDSNGSQFFVTLGALPHLDGKHVVFGQVVEGLETVQKISLLPLRVGKKDEPAEKPMICECGSYRDRSSEVTVKESEIVEARRTVTKLCNEHTNRDDESSTWTGVDLDPSTVQLSELAILGKPKEGGGEEEGVVVVVVDEEAEVKVEVEVEAEEVEVAEEEDEEEDDDEDGTMVDVGGPMSVRNYEREWGRAGRLIDDEKILAVTLGEPKEEASPYLQRDSDSTTITKDKEEDVSDLNWLCHLCNVRNPSDSSACRACNTTETSRCEWMCAICNVRNSRNQRSSCRACKTIPSSPRKSTIISAIGTDYWNCRICNVRNTTLSGARCRACETMRSSRREWVCMICNVRNSSDRKSCRACETMPLTSRRTKSSSTVAICHVCHICNVPNTPDALACRACKTALSESGEWQWACSICNVRNLSKREACRGCGVAA